MTIKNLKLIHQPIKPLVTTVIAQEKCTLLEEFSQFNLYGQSVLFIEVIEAIKKIASCEAPLLIYGETGTGKENTARAVHYLSPRKDNAFIPINCGAIPENLIESELFGHEKGAYTGADKTQQGLVEIAHNGTLFLDEVDSLSPKAQTVLLRFLQTGEYQAVGCRKLRKSDVNIIAATNANLEKNIQNHTFREDLYYRLNVLKINIPPLRDRLEDIDIIAQNIIKKLSVKYNRSSIALSPETLWWLQQQKWPGNIRELENTILREFLLSDNNIINIKAASHNGNNVHFLNFKKAKEAAIEEFEISYIKKLLNLAEGNISRAAKLAGKERRAFGKLVKKYHIEKQVFKMSKSYLEAP